MGWSLESLLGIRSDVVSVCLRLRHSMMERVSKRIGVLKCHFRPMKLNRVHVRQGTFEFDVSYLCLAEAGIISWPILVLASSRR
jgi:hypothetical protein